MESNGKEAPGDSTLAGQDKKTDQKHASGPVSDDSKPSGNDTKPELPRSRAPSSVSDAGSESLEESTHRASDKAEPQAQAEADGQSAAQHEPNYRHQDSSSPDMKPSASESEVSPQAAATATPSLAQPPARASSTTVMGLPAASSGDIDPSRPLGPAASALLAAAGYATDGSKLPGDGASSEHLLSDGPFSHDIVVAVALAHSGQIERLCAQTLALGRQSGQLQGENKMLASIVEQLREASRKRQEAAASRLRSVKEELKRVKQECASLRSELDASREQEKRASEEASTASKSLQEARDETRAARAAAISAIERANAVSAQLRGGSGLLGHGSAGAGAGAGGVTSAMGVDMGGSLEDITAKLAQYSLGHQLPDRAGAEVGLGLGSEAAAETGSGRPSDGAGDGLDLHGSEQDKSRGGAHVRSSHRAGAPQSPGTVASPSGEQRQHSSQGDMSERDRRGGQSSGGVSQRTGRSGETAPQALSPAAAHLVKLGLRPSQPSPNGGPGLVTPSLQEDVERFKSSGFGIDDAIRVSQEMDRDLQEQRRQHQRQQQHSSHSHHSSHRVVPPQLPGSASPDREGGDSRRQRGQPGPPTRRAAPSSRESTGQRQGQGPGTGPRQHGTPSSSYRAESSAAPAAASVPDDLLKQFPAAAAMIARADLEAARAQEQEQEEGEARGRELGASYGSAVAIGAAGTPGRAPPGIPPTAGSGTPSQALADPPFARGSGYQGARLSGLGKTGPPALYEGQKRRQGYTPYKGRVQLGASTQARSGSKGGGGGAQQLLKKRLLGRQSGNKSGNKTGNKGATPSRSSLGRTTPGRSSRAPRSGTTPGRSGAGASRSVNARLQGRFGSARAGSGTGAGTRGSNGPTNAGADGGIPGMPAPPSLSDFGGPESKALARLSGMRSGGAGMRPARMMTRQ